jgi:predicted negative regulator of RcsB-dependent stress response
MAYDLEEQEQLASLKAWWEKHGNLLMTIAIVICLCVAAFYGWKIYERKQAEQAALAFEGLQKVLAAPDKTAAKVGAATDALLEQFPRTAYASMAALSSAKAHVDLKDMTGAKKYLQWTAEKSKTEELRHVATLRMAAILIDEAKYDEALKLVDIAAPEAFVSQYADRKGDVFFAQNKLGEAKAAYEIAHEKANKRDSSRGIIALKLEASGGKPKPDADPKADDKASKDKSAKDGGAKGSGK